MSDTSTGVYTTNGKFGTDKTVTKGGRRYTYRDGRLVGVTRGAEDIRRTNIQAGINQAKADEAAQQPDLSNVNLGTGSGVPVGVQTATDAIVARLRGGGFGQQLQPSVDALQKMLTENQSALQSGSYMSPVTALQNQLGGLYQQAGTNIGAANTALMNYLAANMANPYANVKPQVGMVDPQFAQLLQEQGVSGAPLAAETAAASQAAQEGAGQFQNLLDVLSGVQSAGLSSRQAEAQMADTFAKQMLEANKAGYNQQLLGMGEQLRQGLEDRIRQGTLDIAGLRGQQASQQETLQNQLIDLISKGGSVSDDILSKLFGVTKKPSGGGKKGTTVAEMKKGKPSKPGTAPKPESKQGGKPAAKPKTKPAAKPASKPKQVSKPVAQSKISNVSRKGKELR